MTGNTPDMRSDDAAERTGASPPAAVPVGPDHDPPAVDADPDATVLLADVRREPPDRQAVHDPDAHDRASVAPPVETSPDAGATLANPSPRPAIPAERNEIAPQSPVRSGDQASPDESPDESPSTGEARDGIESRPVESLASGDVTAPADPLLNADVDVQDARAADTHTGRRPHAPARGGAIRRVRREHRRAAHTARRMAAGVRAGGEQAARGWGAVVDRFNQMELSENAILLGFAVAIGLVGSLGVVAFYRCIDLAFTVFYRWTGQVLGREVLALYRPLITAAGLMTAWTLIRSLRGRPGGENVAAVQLAIARRGGEIPARQAVVRTLAAAVTLGSGASAGSEGPVAVLGSAVGSFLGRAFRFDAERVKVLVGAGAAAGISASFNAPLAGAFFALEEVLGSLAVAAFPPVVVAAVLASVVSRAFLGNHPAFPIPRQYGFTLAREVVLFYPLLGVVAGLVSVLYVRSFFGAESAFARLKVRPWLKPLIGGVIVGLMVWLSGGMLVGYGHLAVRVQVFGRMAWTALALLALGKILATSITMGSGGTGGVFTPSLYIGAATGGAFGVALSRLFPALGIAPEPYALVGMGAVVGAATNAPITAILIVFEMTNDYAIVIPLMLATVIATVVARHVEPDSLYSGWLRRRGEHLEHGADRDVLAGLTVEAVYDTRAPFIGDTATVERLLEHLATADRTEYPVVEEGGGLLGMVTVAELARAAREAPALGGVLLAADLAGPTECVTPADTLLEAVRKMGVRGVGSLPVVDGGGRYLGTVGRAEILAAYQRSAAEPA